MTRMTRRDGMREQAFRHSHVKRLGYRLSDSATASSATQDETDGSEID
jgi:hypothetical protein